MKGDLDPWVHGPGVVRLLRRRFFIASLLWFILWLSACGCGVHSGLLRHPGAIVLVPVWLGAGFLGSGVIDGLEVLRERALKRKATATDNALCCRCGYCLLGHTEIHSAWTRRNQGSARAQCPECGWGYDNLEQVQAIWRYWQPKKPPWWFRGVQAIIGRVRR